MMDAIHCNVTPAYRGIQTQPKRAGLLAGLSSLIGCGPALVYKTADGGSVQAPAPCPWWCRLFSVTPHYQTAEPRYEEIDLDAAAPGSGDAAAPPPEGAAPATVVIL
jgi:hypothetical protein